MGFSLKPTTSKDWRVLDPATETDALTSKLSRLLIGQPEAIAAMAKHVTTFNSGLHPPNRPAGVVLLLGPTGTGKTHSCEALAEVIHGSRKNLLKIDCGEFQLEHEVAKLIGAPPGYLGHRESVPMLSQVRVNKVSSSNSVLSLILFDEIEKASHSLKKMLLGINDRATLVLGDGSTVDFENCLIFLTTNLGAKEMQAETYGYCRENPSKNRLTTIGLGAVKRHFTPEFVNRIDSFVTYGPLIRDSCEQILTLLFDDFQNLICERLGHRSFVATCSGVARDALLNLGVSPEYGARELRRTLERSFHQPVAALLEQGRIKPGATVMLDTNGNGGFSIMCQD